MNSKGSDISPCQKGVILAREGCFLQCQNHFVKLKGILVSSAKISIGMGIFLPT